jgi:DNA repair protein RecO (recombination protein O)
MLQKTRGLVLNFLRYRETSVIVHIYTEEFGIQSYIENGVRSSKGRNKAALFQPLTLLDLVVYHKEKGGIQRLSEAKISHPFRSIPFEFAKSSIGLFLTEMLSKTLKEESSNPPLFHFLTDSVLWLDEATAGYENFHLVFLLQLAAFLGFAPDSGIQIADQLREHGLPVFDDEALRLLDALTTATYDRSPTMGRAMRNYLLELLLKFYDLHLDGLGEIKSLPVLQEVMR